MPDIVIVEPGHPLAQQALHLVQNEAMLSWVILFGGDRWHCVEHVAVAMQDNEPVGMATLSPHDEMSAGGPHVIGIWVHPEYRRQGIATEMLKILVEESQRRYGTVPTVVPVTRVGLHLIESALRQGIALERKGGMVSSLVLP